MSNRRTLLWFKRGIDDPHPWEITVTLPEDQTIDEERYYLERIASGVVALMRSAGVTGVIIQGQFKETANV